MVGKVGWLTNHTVVPDCSNWDLGSTLRCQGQGAATGPGVGVPRNRVHTGGTEGQRHGPGQAWGTARTKAAVSAAPGIRTTLDKRRWH